MFLWDVSITVTSNSIPVGYELELTKMDLHVSCTVHLCPLDTWYARAVHTAH